MKPGSRWNPVRVSAANSADGPQPLDDAADFEHRVEGQCPRGDQAVRLEVPHHGAVGADDRSGVPQLVLQGVQPARRASGDEHQFDAGVAAGVEGADGPVADFAVMPEDRSVNVTCYQPHSASLRGRTPALAAARRRARRTRSGFAGQFQRSKMPVSVPRPRVCRDSFASRLAGPNPASSPRCRRRARGR